MKRKSIKKLMVLVFTGLFLAALPLVGYAIQNETPGFKYTSGPYGYTTTTLTGYAAGATVYLPASGTPPYSAIVFMQPYTGTQAMDAAWGPFFASHGIIYVNCDSTTTLDTVDSRATQQMNAVNLLKSSSKFVGKLDKTRVGVMGWSMGGGASWINSANTGIKTALTLAGHNLTAVSAASKGYYTKCPTAIFSGSLDTTYLGGLGQSEGVYAAIPSTVSKLHYKVATAGHMVWGGPTTASVNVGAIALAFQKTYLDGDTRWKAYITRPLDAAIWTTNLK
jgi:dienelactone hydrolase